MLGLRRARPILSVCRGAHCVQRICFTRGVVLGADGRPVEGSKKTAKSPSRTNASILDGQGKPIDYTVVERTEKLSDKYSNSQNLEIIIKNVIKTAGPVPISSFMKQCLINPEYGYYTTRNPLDAKTGDFITSPEISSTFGEICGLWFFSCFLAQLKHQATHNRANFRIAEKTFRIVEFGPGKGTLMHDMVRTLNRFVKGKNPIEVVFVEKSEVLIYEQYKTMCDVEASKLEKVDNYCYTAVSKWGNKIVWMLDDKPELGNDQKYMNFVMAHEFYDALTMNKFIKTEKGWREFLIDMKPAARTGLLPNVETTSSVDLGQINKSEFMVVQAPYATPSAAIPRTNARYDSLPVGSEVEISAESHAYMYEMSDIVKSSDIGAGLVIDYGTTTIPINTLRGIKDHKFVNPLAEPGEVDLSIDVDFGALAEILADRGMKSYTAEQGDFLNAMGLGYRIDQLLSKHVDDEDLKKNIIGAYKRLTGKGLKEMGKIYKVMGYYSNTYSAAEPSGFAKAETQPPTAKTNKKTESS